jgi:Ca2+-binding EF-hand superfamily protein
VSSFFNLFVLYYHYSHAPHPKFVILKQRRFVIYTHIISGVLEFITCWVAFCTGNKYIATIAALAAICGHVPSAYYQTSIVFGAKALMVSGYLFAISLHLFSALHLFMDPSSTYWLLNMFLIHNIYVWCRVFYFLFGFVGVFKDTLYTNSILTSGLLLFPDVLGVSANIFFLGYVTCSILLYFIIVQPNEADRAAFINERTRDLIINETVHRHWINEKARMARVAKDEQLTDQQQAKQVFDQLDMNKNGYLDGEEINNLLKEWEAAEAFMKRFSRWSKKGNITYENFYKNVWRLGDTSVKRAKEFESKEGIERARFVFNCLDNDSSGYIEISELQKLLIQWGLPDNEVDAYLVDDDDKRYSFDEFYQNMKPRWDFAYENMSVSNAGQVVKPIHPHAN